LASAAGGRSAEVLVDYVGPQPNDGKSQCIAMQDPGLWTNLNNARLRFDGVCFRWYLSAS
jgi:hypothetical protein